MARFRMYWPVVVRTLTYDNPDDHYDQCVHVEEDHQINISIDAQHWR